MQKIVILGGIGNGTVIAQAIVDAQNRGHESAIMCGYLNDREEIGSQIEGFPVLGKVHEAKDFAEQGYKIINTIYRIDGAKERLDLFKTLNIQDEDLAIFVHPAAYVAPNVIVEPGAVIMPYVMISASATIRKGSLLMVGCSVGHDTVLGEGTHVAAQAVVGAHIKFGKGVHVGLNATIRENLKLGDYSTVGMGAVLTKSIGEKEIWAGNPARFLRMAE
jgi:sugar O-acyltransferase (sialic acid O-acetyltransferase NeuD family)